MAELEQQELAIDPIGSRLKAAREAQGLSLDDVAAKTRVPIRHLIHMEKGEWDELPAPTYSVGFARAYASAVGLNASEIGTELRSQLNAVQAAPTAAYYEPADPARVPPRSLTIVAAVAALLLVTGYLIWRSYAVGDGDETPIEQQANLAAPGTGAPAPPPGAPVTTSSGPVVLTATADVWLRVYEAGGDKLFEDMLKAGQRYEVPVTAQRPQIMTGRPDALRVTVGTTQIPPLGPAEKTISDVSLLPADLLARASTSTAAPAPAPRPAPARSAPARSPRAPTTTPTAPAAGATPQPAPAAAAEPAASAEPSDTPR